MKNPGAETTQRSRWPVAPNGLHDDSPSGKHAAEKPKIIRHAEKIGDYSVEQAGPRGQNHKIRNGAQHRSQCLSEHLFTYEYDRKLARDENIIVTVKTTLQIHRNIRQEEQQLRARPDIFG